MSHNPGILLTLAGNFALNVAVRDGGANAAFPRDVPASRSTCMHWMTDRQFADLYRIAQVTPGPNVIVVTLIGYHVAGLAGALVATLAMCGPTCVFAFFVGQVWDRFKEARVAADHRTAFGPNPLRFCWVSSTLVIARGGTVLAKPWR